MNTPFILSGNATSAAPVEADFSLVSSDAWVETGSRGYSVHGYVANQGTSTINVTFTDRNNKVRTIPLIGYSSQPWDWNVKKVSVAGLTAAAVPVVIGAR